MTLKAQVTALGNLPAVIASRFASKVALISGKREITYAELDERTNRIANALTRRGVGAGDRVALVTRDPLDAILLVFGAAKAKAVSVNINPRLAAPEVGHIISDSLAKLLFVDDEFDVLVKRAAEAFGQIPGIVASRTGRGAPADDWYATESAAAPRCEYDPEDVVVQIYTSGTTGRPKGVQLPNRSFFALAERLEAARDPWIGWSDRSVSLLFVPLFHIGGLWWLIRGLALGSTNIVLPSFDPSTILRAIPEYRVTKTCMVPSMAQVLLREPGCRRTDFRSLETIVYGGSPIAADVLTMAMDVFGCDFSQIYGMTETGNMAVCFRPDDHRRADARRLRAAGTPLPGVEVRIVDRAGNDLDAGMAGEIVIKSPAAMTGYWRTSAGPPAATGGWIATGDVGYRDDEGFIYVCDRLKDMIISAGENIYPAEIETALRLHAAVADVAVIGVPDRLRGEMPKAFVVRAAGTQVRAADLVRHARAHVAEFKVPTSIQFVAELPRNASGKVLKNVLREQKSA